MGFQMRHLPFGDLDRIFSAVQKFEEEWRKRSFVFYFFQKTFLFLVGNLKISHDHCKIQCFTGFQMSYRSLESRGNMQDFSLVSTPLHYLIFSVCLALTTLQFFVVGQFIVIRNKFSIEWYVNRPNIMFRRLLQQ